MKHKLSRLSEWQMPPFIAEKLLKAKKESYKKIYNITESLNSSKFGFIHKKTHEFNRTLIYSGKDNIYYDTKRKKYVNEHTSAFVLLIIERQYKRSYIPIGGWSNKGNKKCRTRIIAIPNNREEIQYTYTYVLEHPEEFTFHHQCKIFTPNGNKMSTIQVLNNKDKELRAKSIYLMRKNKIPIKTIAKIHKVSVRQAWREVIKGKELILNHYNCQFNFEKYVDKKYGIKL